jgi:AraC family transcriptional regulator of adaptative response / DNA-3-methyladenine glycosylase II
MRMPGTPLDRQVCSRARISRDPRFDGKFFIGVKGSGVYCRPTCPAPHAMEKNCRYFATAAAAAAAGFRPCMRCRPECSPGTPAWLGTSNTVSRALRLIDESGLADGGVERFAERLGIGARHLRRLFLKHLGATPSAIARTRRLHFAKKLIDETSLPMSQVAIASGFGCVRRFNAAFHTRFKRTPTHIRKIAFQTDHLPEDHYLFRLGFRPPYDWQGLLRFLAPTAIPGVEVLEPHSYGRTIFHDGKAGFFSASRDENGLSVSVRMHFPDSRGLFFIVERIRRIFDLNADSQCIAARLRMDPALARRVAAHPGLRVPGCWDGFELAIRAVLAQHSTGKTAAALTKELVATHGKPFAGPPALTHVFPRPEILAEARLTGLGWSSARTETIRQLARAVCDGTVSFDHVLDPQDFVARLCAVPGIATSTAQYVALRALSAPDVLPTGDVRLLRALRLGNAQQLEERSQVWRPWRAYAAMYLWHGPDAAKTHEDILVSRAKEKSGRIHPAQAIARSSHALPREAR